MSDNAVVGLAFGILFALNLISLLLVYVTPLGKDYLADLKKTNTKGYVIFWHFWMVLFGFTFWIAMGFQALFDWIKKLKGEA